MTAATAHHITIPDHQDDLPLTLRQARWTLPELRGVVALAQEHPMPGFVRIYGVWAHAQGFLPRSPGSVLRALQVIGLDLTGRLPWSPVELDRLRDLCDDFPRGCITPVYNNWAAQNGCCARSNDDLAAAADEHFGVTDPWRPTGTWLLLADAAEMLQIPAATIRQWIYDQRFIPHREPDGTFYVRRNSFIWMARNQPELLAAANPSRFGLMAMLDKEYLVDRVLAACHPTVVQPRPQPVQRLDDLRWWPSIKIAACCCHLSVEDIERSALTGTPASSGTSFRFLQLPARYLEVVA